MFWLFSPSFLSSTQIEKKNLIYTDMESLVFVLYGLPSRFESDVFLYFDPHSLCSFNTCNLPICVQQSKSKVAFHLFPCCVKASKWCVVGKWNISVDNICLSRSSELIEARPWLSVPLLSLYLHLQGQPRTLGKDFPSLTPLLYKCLWVSGVLLLPLQAQCRLWVAKQCAQRTW